MYQVGDRVIYGAHGVCDVTGVEDRVEDRKQVSYLVLEPVGQPGSRYLLPAQNPVAMAKVHKVLTVEELEQLFHSPEVQAVFWIREENLRRQSYRELIGSGDRKRILAMVHSLYHHKREQAEAGRKVHLCDENFLRNAEKLLVSEISVVMNIEPVAAKQYIRKKLNCE